MYLEHFGLQMDPFKLDPSLDFVFVSTGHEEAIAHLVYGIEQGESFVLITGGIGTGKTLALHFLLDQIVSSFKTAFINVTQINFLELLKLILDDLDIPFDRSGDRADLLHVLKNVLLETRDKREKVLIVVDEAQELSLETLEALRLLSNLTQPGEQVLQIVIAGQPGLAKLIAAPELEQLRQRIRVRYELETLSVSEVGPYIEHRLTVAGCKDSIFTKDALRKIFDLSNGIPRLVNYQADKALLAAFVEGDAKVELSHVEEDEEAVAAPVLEQKPKTSIGSQNPVDTVEPKSSPKIAMSAMKDVDLDEIRDSRPTRKPAPSSSESKKITVALWIIIPVLLLSGAWFVYSQTDYLQSLFSDVPLTLDHESILSEPEAPVTGILKTEKENVRVEDADIASQSAGISESIEELPLDPIISEPEFVIHVASFQIMERANNLLADFQKEGLEAYIEGTKVKDTTWFRLYLGPFNSRELAQSNGQGLKNKGIIDYFLVTEQTQN